MIVRLVEKYSSLPNVVGTDFKDEYLNKTYIILFMNYEYTMLI